MTTVYGPHSEAGYEWVMPMGSTGPLWQLRYRSRGDPWSPLWMNVLTTDAQGHPWQEADMPWHGTDVLVLKRRAREVLEKTLADDAEMLALYDDDGDDLWLVHAWRVVDALDEDRSQVRRFRDGGVMTVDRFVFREAVIAGLKCFRIPQQQQMFVTDDVVAAVRAAGLRGTTFRPVWSSEGSTRATHR